MIRLIGSSFANTSIHDDQHTESLPVHVRTQFEPRFGDLSKIRVHPNATEITQPLNARAVTRGFDIYFHPGQFRPDTPAGMDLLAHELAHTLQTRQSENTIGQQTTFFSHSGDALEKNADALAHGKTNQAFVAPSGATLCSPFDNETAEDRTRREHLLKSIISATARLQNLLRTGGLVKYLETETIRADVSGIIYGQPGADNEGFISYAERRSYINQIIIHLIAMERLYRNAQIPADFSAPKLVEGEYQSEVVHSTGTGKETGTAHFGSKNSDWVELQTAYDRYLITKQLDNSAFSFYGFVFLDPSNIIIPSSAPRTSNGAPSGAYIVIPDIEHKPLEYRLLSGFESVPPGSSDVIELWSDDFGYYYTRKDQRIYVRNPWK